MAPIDTSGHLGPKKSRTERATEHQLCRLRLDDLKEKIGGLFDAGGDRFFPILVIENHGGRLMFRWHSGKHKYHVTWHPWPQTTKATIDRMGPRGFSHEHQGEAEWSAFVDIDGAVEKRDQIRTNFTPRRRVVEMEDLRREPDPRYRRQRSGPQWW
jgi:hypothetical protein